MSIPRKESNAMKGLTTSAAIPTSALKTEALTNISASFELFCLASGVEALAEMMDRDAQAACGPRHARGLDRRAHRWGKTKGKIGFHGGKVEIERPRLRSFEGKEQPVPSWEAAVAEDWLGKWAMNQMLINVSTRKFARSVRLPEGMFQHLRAVACRNRPPLAASSRCRRRA
jgi:putative transposase